MSLSAMTLRNLSDRAYDKRKSAALEIESKVKEIMQNGSGKDKHEVEKILNTLSKDFALSTQSNFRKGGLIGLAAASLGLGSEASTYLSTLLPPVLACFTDQDSRVRYYACEALYNMAKVSRASLLGSFNAIFEGLARLCSDIDTGVKNAAQLLDALLMDIVAQADSFDLDTFVPILHAHLRQKNAFVRHFLLGWITSLLKRPGLDMVSHSPLLLDGLFAMLTDSSKEIRSQADAVVERFLRGLEERDAAGNPLEYTRVIPVLIKCASYKAPSVPEAADGDALGEGFADETPDKGMQLGVLSRRVSLLWLRRVMELGKEKVLSFTGELVPLLLNIEQSGQRLKCAGSIVNEARYIAKDLRELIRGRPEGGGEGVDHSQVLVSVMLGLQSQSKITRLESLEWIELLMEIVPATSKAKSAHLKVGKISHILPILLRSLQDPDEEVVKRALVVVSSACAEEGMFGPVMQELVLQFRNDRTVLQERGGLVVRQLCVCLGPHKVFLNMASLLEREERDLDFAEALTDKLALILLTAPETHALRGDLVDDKQKAKGGLFHTLYACWCLCPVAALSLCLLSQEYATSCKLATAIGRRLQTLPADETVGLLVQLDRLVQLLEAPLFVPLRLHLIAPARYPHLVKTLYTILMVLPQSEVFETLRRRLKSVPTAAMMQLYPHGGDDEVGGGLDSEELERMFVDKARQRENAQRLAQGGKDPAGGVIAE